MLSQKALYVDNTLDFHKFSWTQTKDAVPNIKRGTQSTTALCLAFGIFDLMLSVHFFPKWKEPGQTKWDQTPQTNIYNGNKMIAR